MADWVAGKVVRNQQWNETHFSVVIDAPVEQFSAGQFLRVALDIDNERVGRPYSCVNSPHERLLEIFFNIVPEGPLSGRLAALVEGDDVWVTAQGNGLLTVAQVPEHVENLWLLSTGTAVGPFLSILKTEETWRRFDRIVLAYGVRFASDLAYQNLIARLLAQHREQLDYVPFITREDQAGSMRGRIPAAVADGRLEQHVGIKLNADSSHVMLCGNAGMIADVAAVLEARGMKKHRRNASGHYSTEKYH